MLEIEGAGCRIGGVDAVDKDLGLIRIGAADKDGRHSARPAGLDDIEAWHVLQRIRQCSCLRSISSLGMTVMLLPTSLSGVGRRVGVTTTGGNETGREVPSAAEA